MKILLAVFLAVFLLAVTQLFRSGAGVMPRSSPSSSSQSASRLGVLVRKLVVKEESGDSDVVVTDAWIEQIVLRYESIPIRKKTLGERLCVRVEYSKKAILDEGESLGVIIESLEAVNKANPDSSIGSSQLSSKGATISTIWWPIKAPELPLIVDVIAVKWINKEKAIRRPIGSCKLVSLKDVQRKDSEEEVTPEQSPDKE